MKRRHLLATTVTAVGLAGCSSVRDAVSPPPDVPEGMAVETRHWVADVLEDSIWQQKRKNGEDPGAYDTTIADRSAARERIADTETTDGFVEERISTGRTS